MRRSHSESTIYSTHYLIRLPIKTGGPHAGMSPSCCDALLVEGLHRGPAHLLLLEPCQGHVDRLHLVVDIVPAFLDDLASFFVAHKGKLGLYLCCGLALVDTIRADPFDVVLDTSFKVAFQKQVLLLAPQFVRECLDFPMLLLVGLVQVTGLFFKSLSLVSPQGVPLGDRAVEGDISGDS